MPVTAQDIKKFFSIKHTLGGHMLVYDLEKVEAMLSQARQEARREALKEMDEAHEEIWESSQGDDIDRCKIAGEKFAKLRQEYYNQP